MELELLEEREETARARPEEPRVQPAVLHEQTERARDRPSRLVHRYRGRRVRSTA